jgi:ABC-type transport system involved in cytochrome c biogenesis permease subunit
MIVAKIIDGHAAWQAVWTAAVAGVGVTIVFSFAVLGATRSTDLRRDNRPVPAALFGLISLVGLAATLATVVYAITLITTK